MGCFLAEEISTKAQLVPDFGGETTGTHLEVRAVQHGFEEGLVVGVQTPTLDRPEQHDGQKPEDNQAGSALLSLRHAEPVSWSRIHRSAVSDRPQAVRLQACGARRPGATLRPLDIRPPEADFTSASRREGDEP